MPQAPYAAFPFIDAAVDVSSVDWTPPNNIRIGELRCKAAGTIKIDTPYLTGVSLPVLDGDIQTIEITKIYSDGTDAGLATGNIVVYGWNKSL